MTRKKRKTTNKKRKQNTNSNSFIWIFLASVVTFFIFHFYRPEYSNASADTLSMPAQQSYEIPKMNHNMGQLIERKGYTLSYNSEYKTPYWVGWELTKSETKGNAKRTDKFLPDPNVNGAKAYTEDYSRSGYDRGHMAPAADMRWDKNVMAQSFYLSNICPQNPNLNRGDWNDLEELSRTWAVKYGSIYITCGPIYDKKYPKRIGKNKVAVPDAFYKCIFINDRIKPMTIGFIFDNKAGNHPLIKYVVTIDSIEKRTGIDFFPAIPDKLENKLEAEIITKLP